MHEENGGDLPKNNLILIKRPSSGTNRHRIFRIEGSHLMKEEEEEKEEQISNAEHILLIKTCYERALTM